MRPAAIGTAIAGIAIVVGLIVVGGQRLGGASGATDLAATVPDAPPSTQQEPAAQPTTNPGASMAARPIDDASQFYPAVMDGQPLEREAAPQPEKKPQLVAENGIDLPRPVAESAGILGFGDKRLQLAGLTPTPVNKMCSSPDGASWPCGMLAKTNFRLFLRLRTVHCDLGNAQWTGTATAACRIGAQDLSEWLIESGWAEAADGSPFSEAGAKARETKIGLYGSDPRQGGVMANPDISPVEGISDPL